MQDEHVHVVSNEYDIDQPIPDEKTLAEEFGCSRMTMKRALDTLRLKGCFSEKRARHVYHSISHAG